jgi:hypothetical protein
VSSTQAKGAWQRTPKEYEALKTKKGALVDDEGNKVKTSINIY